MKLKNQAVSMLAKVALLAQLGLFLQGTPVFAQEGPPIPLPPPTQVGGIAPLTSLSSTISSPALSSCDPSNQNNPCTPEYTNVSYSWKQSSPFIFNATSSCITIQGQACVQIIIDTDDLTTLDSNKYEHWKSAIFITDINYTGPANSYVIDVTASDFDDEGQATKEELTLNIGCTAACTFTTTNEQTLDVIDSGLIKPYGGISATPNVYESYKEIFYIASVDVSSPGTAQAGQTVNNYGSGLNVTASIDASLTFQYAGTSGSSFYDEPTIIDSSDSGCFFSTLTPNYPEVCVFDVVAGTNAPNGFSIYVVQDQNMTFNGNTIKQFTDGTRTDDLAATTWVSPSTNAGAHLGYSSNDTSVFPPASGSARWAGIPTKVAAGVAAASPVGLVANENSPGLSTGGKFALKIEAGPNQPQAVSTLGQEYSNNLYFIVVGNF